MQRVNNRRDGSDRERVQFPPTAAPQQPPLPIARLFDIGQCRINVERVVRPSLNPALKAAEW
jgi:hypothetical protein